MLRLPLILLLGPACGLFAGSNSIRTKGGTPLDLDKVVSALWTDSVEIWSESDEWSDAYGRGELLLSSAEISCDDIRDGSIYDEQSPLWDSSGLVASLRWSAWSNSSGDATEQDWEGSYYSGIDYERYDDGVWSSRWMSSGLYADGMAFELYYDRGEGEIKSYDKDTVSGRIDTQFYVARFEAENCGSTVEKYDDYWEYWDYGYWDAARGVQP